ncbi:unnamed protein product [Rotaria socialis]|uniref:Uncharacterized protein n=1 Tax=Rotaria socialis TaxID=392032 RepID=A0A821VYQ7_9BILA|nr:unnamed protein product [Rotaria socialis]CAF3184202.1 unnamed protein product [Rotaria socialis]CAF3674732.1 unnamed protein product [Rotaria socialis]CAF4509293.1 unnamed protein product [Rotaria socialis]CAF4541022.1 unnamed protein product [Rotaria socialis]
MSYARRGPTASLLGNSNVLVTGGANGSITLNTAELYDPSTGTWMATPNMQHARENHAAAVLTNENVIVIGGWNHSSNMNAVESYNSTTGGGGGGGLNSTELHDPLTGTWSITRSMNVPRSEHAAVALLNGIVLVAGGINVTDEKTAELYRLLGINQ